MIPDSWIAQFSDMQTLFSRNQFIANEIYYLTIPYFRPRVSCSQFGTLRLVISYLGNAFLSREWRSR